MAGEIDNLQIRISASADGASKSINKLADALEKLGDSNLLQLSSRFESMAQSFGSLSDACKNIQNAVSNITVLNQSLQSLSRFDGRNIDQITGFLRQLKSVEINPEFANSLKSIGQAVNAISKAKVNEKAADNLRYFIDTIRILTDEDVARLNAVSQAAASLNSANFKAITDIQQAANPIEQVSESASHATKPLLDFTGAAEYFKNIGRFVETPLKLIVSPLKTVASGFASAASKAKQFLSSIKRIAMYRAVRAILKSITDGFAEGRKNLYYYSKEVGTEFAPSMDRAATAALYFKNSIGAATAPLTNAFVPVLERVVDHVVELLNRFNQLTAAMTGASTWTRAVRYPTQWQDALDDAEESARRLKSTMLGFDELNVIEKAIGQGGRGNTSNIDYSRMFEEMPTERDFLNNIPEYLAPIRLAWDAEGDNTLNAIRNAWREIADLVQSVGVSFSTVWQNGTGQRTLEIILQIVQNIAGTFGAIAGGIRRAWNEGGRGTRIFQNIWNIVNNLLSVFRNILGSIREWAEGLDWSPLLSSIENITDAFQRFVDPNGSPAQLLQYFFEHVLEPLATWTIEEAVPAAIDLFAGAIDGLRVALEFLQPALEVCIDAISYIAGLTFSNLSGLVEGLGSVLTIASGGEVSDEAVERLERSNDRIRGLFQSITEFFGFEYTGGLNDALQDFGSNQLWNLLNPDDGAMSDLGEDFYEWFHGGGQEFGSMIYDAWNSGVEEIQSDTAMLSMGGTSSFFTEFFDNWNTGMDEFVQTWQSGWQSISDFFTGIWEGITSAVDGFASAWSDGWNTIRTGAQEGWQSVQNFLETGWNRITGFVSNYINSWVDGWRTIKSTVQTTWSNLRSSLSNGWNGLKGFVTDFKSHWIAGFDEIRDGISGKWDQIKISLSSGWETIKSKVSDYATKWSTTFEIIKRNVNVKFLEIKDAITNSVIWQAVERTVDRIRTAFSNAFQGAINTAGGFIASIQNVFNHVYDVIRNPINRALDAMEGLVNGAVDMIAGILQRLVDLTGPAREAFERVTGISLDISWNIPYFSLPRFANGGFPDSGQLFLARESGAEMVGSIGGHTAVANNDQIVQAISTGVYNAVMSAMQNQNGGQNEFHIYLSGREISAEVNQVSRDNGASILGGVVYGV